MKKLSLYLFAMVLALGNLFAQAPQNLIKVNGSIADSLSGETIPYATLSVYKLPDVKEAVKRLATNVDGEFSFELNQTGDYLLEVSSIEIKNYKTKFSIAEGETKHNFGTINISKSTTEIAEVDVVAQKQLIKIEADKIVYNTEADPDAKTSTAMDLMRRVPMVSVDGDDNIQLKGSSNFKIYMNGKPSPLLTSNTKDVLNSMSANNIKNIEVITSPGAKYDAEGTGGIINIVTEKQLLSGYSGSVNTGYNSNGRYNAGLNFTAAIKKFTFSINAGGMYNAGQDNRSVMEQENYLSSEQRYMNTEGNSRHSGMFRRGSTSFSYEVDTLNLISGSFNLWGGNFDSESSSFAEINSSENTLFQSYHSYYNMSHSFGSLSGNVDYQNTSKKNKDRIFTLSYRIDNSPRANTNQQEIANDYNFYDNKEYSDQDDKGLEQTFQLDYVIPLSAKVKLETGAKFILRNNDSKTDVEVYDFDNSIYEYDHNQSIDFEHTQSITAGYASLGGNLLKKFNYKAGVRVENSLTDVKYKNGTSDNFDVENLEVVPSVSFSYQINQKNSMQLAYSKRIHRPGIWHLNPYVDDSNPKNIRYGNENLDPEHYHQVDLNYNLFMKTGNINISTFYSYSDNGINSVSWVDEDNVVYNTYDNVAKENKIGSSLNLNLRFGRKMSFMTNFTGSYVAVENAKDETQSNDGWNFGGYARYQYNFAKTFKLSVYGGVWTQSVELQRKMSPFYHYGLSITKEFLKKKLNVSLAVREFAEKEKSFTFETFDDTYYQTSTRYRPGRNLSINVSYRFGEMKSVRVKKARKTIRNNDVKSGGDSQGTGGGQGGE